MKKSGGVRFGKRKGINGADSSMMQELKLIKQQMNAQKLQRRRSKKQRQENLLPQDFWRRLSPASHSEIQKAFTLTIRKRARHSRQRCETKMAPPAAGINLHHRQ